MGRIYDDLLEHISVSGGEPWNQVPISRAVTYAFKFLCDRIEKIEDRLQSIYEAINDLNGRSR